jgi:hypothetical protein
MPCCSWGGFLQMHMALSGLKSLTFISNLRCDAAPSWEGGLLLGRVVYLCFGGITCQAPAWQVTDCWVADCLFRHKAGLLLLLVKVCRTVGHALHTLWPLLWLLPVENTHARTHAHTHAGTHARTLHTCSGQHAAAAHWLHELHLMPWLASFTGCLCC